MGGPVTESAPCTGYLCAGTVAVSPGAVVTPAQTIVSPHLRVVPKKL